MTLALLICSFALSNSPRVAPRDELLDKMVGTWRITRQFAKRKAENTAKIAWTLNDHWLRIDMEDVQKPSKYAAHVYITQMQSDKSYSIHWLDTYGGTLPESLGVGHRKGDSIVFVWKDSDGEMRNTFTWHRKDDTWTSKIEQTGKDGKWSSFCTDTYVRSGL